MSPWVLWRKARAAADDEEHQPFVTKAEWSDALHHLAVLMACMIAALLVFAGAIIWLTVFTDGQQDKANRRQDEIRAAALADRKCADATQAIIVRDLVDASIRPPSPRLTAAFRAAKAYAAANPSPTRDLFIEVLEPSLTPGRPSEQRRIFSARREELVKVIEQADPETCRSVRMDRAARNATGGAP